MATERAVLAGGCFWGMQDLIRKNLFDRRSIHDIQHQVIPAPAHKAELTACRPFTVDGLGRQLNGRQPQPTAHHLSVQRAVYIRSGRSYETIPSAIRLDAVGCILGDPASRKGTAGVGQCDRTGCVRQDIV